MNIKANLLLLNSRESSFPGTFLEEFLLLLL